jgi:hypothetical protein
MCQLCYALAREINAKCAGGETMAALVHGRRRPGGRPLHDLEVFASNVECEAAALVLEALLKRGSTELTAAGRAGKTPLWVTGFLNARLRRVRALLEKQPAGWRVGEETRQNLKRVLAEAVKEEQA